MTRHSGITGHYVYLDVSGTEYRVYYEEAGQGIPLLCQHTAGADGGQWRHLLEDPEVTARFRVIAHDLPWHGKSLPPLGSAWWAQQYQLTTERFMQFVVSFADALDLADPVYLGCSMGGHLAADLALYYPDRFRAVIGVEGGLVTPGSEQSVLHNFHPRVSNEFKAAVMYTLTSPLSPEAGRRDATWHYLQGAPSVHRGDLYYYVGGHDLTGRAGDIDTTRIPVYLMSGEYDWSTTTAETRKLAEEIPGARFVEMPDIGHFPMVENYPLFQSHLLSILAEILDRSGSASSVPSGEPAPPRPVPKPAP